jgi:putative hydrolase of the HAD superfamily
LIDLEQAIRLGIEGHLASLGLPFDAEVYTRWKRLEVFHVQQYVDGRAGFQEQRRSRARGMSESRLSDAEADAWFDGFHSRMEAEQQLFDDVEAALAYVETELRVPIGIVTNMDTPYQLGKLTRVGLSAERFNCFLGLDTLPAPKPHPEAFLHACAALGVEAGPQVLFIGDDLNADALGARSAGLRGVWLDRPAAFSPVPLPPVSPLPDSPPSAAGAPAAPADPPPPTPAGIERITGLDQLPALLAARPRGSRRAGGHI